MQSDSDSTHSLVRIIYPYCGPSMLLLYRRLHALLSLCLHLCVYNYCVPLVLHCAYVHNCILRGVGLALNVAPLRYVMCWCLIMNKMPCVYFRVEKYRPATLQELISHEDIISTSKYCGTLLNAFILS